MNKRRRFKAKRKRVARRVASDKRCRQMEMLRTPITVDFGVSRHWSWEADDNGHNLNGN